MKQLLLLTALLSPVLPTFAQTELHCGSDEMHFQFYQQRPDLHAGIARANAQLSAFTRAYEQAHEKSNALYTIPVVFHVIHNNGSENISDMQIHDAIAQLNLQYRKLNADTSNIVTSFQSIAADAQIEFKLAQLDPDGNCTSGITRTVSTLTYIGDHQVKNLIHWPREKYLNIYVCYDAAGLAGHALMPGVADTIPEWDGIVIRHDYVGTIGTSDYFKRTVLSHEVGHFLNLYHIWGGNNVPNFYYLPVGDPGNCAYDDEVADTPNTKGWSSCNTSAQSCGSTLDNVQNYMDYAYCALMFTEGQKVRMHAALNSSVAGRNNLWQPSNHIATGIAGNDLLCKANVYCAKRIICTNESAWLVDVSYHGVTGRTWDIPNATVLSQSGDSIEVLFDNPGQYDVSLSVTNGIQTIDSTFANYLTVIPATGSSNGLLEGFEDGFQALDLQWVFPSQETTYNWEIATTGYNSSHSITVNNFEGENNQTYMFHSLPVDVSGVNSLAISFDWAYAQRTHSSNDLLKIQLSTDCGQTWVTRRTYSGIGSLQSINDTLATAFIPTNPNEWNSDIISMSGSTYLTDHTMVQFRFESKGGNNLYIDNICMGEELQLSSQQHGNTDLQCFPNPTENLITLKWNEPVAPGSITLCTADGQVLRTFPVDSKNTFLVLDLNDLSNGIYFIHCLTQNGKLVEQVTKR